MSLKVMSLKNQMAVVLVVHRTGPARQVAVREHPGAPVRWGRCRLSRSEDRPCPTPGRPIAARPVRGVCPNPLLPPWRFVLADEGDR